MNHPDIKLPVTPVKYAYLDEQFADVEAYFDDLRQLVKTGEFTIGPFVETFEKKFVLAFSFLIFLTLF